MDRSIGLPGIRYITEELIRKISGQDHLDSVTSLNLTLIKEGGKIKFIEQLEKLKNLQSLSLSNNLIEKIEKLDKLTHLRELNLSFNCLTKIENLEPLVSLQVLNLAGNQIVVIPLWLGKKLKALRVLKLAKNKIESLQEFAKLRPLANLIQLTTSDNPISKLPHSRLFLVFHLSTLEVLDECEINVPERAAAHQRFEQEEIARLTAEIEKREAELVTLTEVHNRSIHEVEERGTKQQMLEETTRQLKQKVKEMSQELDAKDSLIRKKQSELSKACEKHYELEQELAFYKIDHKFETLTRPKLQTPDSSLSTDDGPMDDESPYIGKGRFRASETAREQHIVATGSQAQYGNINDSHRDVRTTATRFQQSGQGEGHFIDAEMLKVKEDFDRELATKKKKVPTATLR